MLLITVDRAKRKDTVPILDASVREGDVPIGE